MRKLKIHMWEIQQMSVKLEKSASQKHVSLLSLFYMFIIVCTCIHTYLQHILTHTLTQRIHTNTHKHINTHTYNTDTHSTYTDENVPRDTIPT